MKQDVLKQLHDAVAKDLLARVMSGGAEARDLAVAVKFLKDNGIECLPEASKPMRDLSIHLPQAFAGPDEYVQ